MSPFGDLRNKVESLLCCYGASGAFTQTIMSLKVCYSSNTQKMLCLLSLPHFETRVLPSGSRPANQTAAGLKQVKQADWDWAAQFLLYLTGHGATMAVSNCVKYLLFFFNLLFWVSITPMACLCGGAHGGSDLEKFQDAASLHYLQTKLQMLLFLKVLNWPEILNLGFKFLNLELRSESVKRLLHCGC